MKKIISLVLAVVLVAMTFPMVAFAAEAGDVNNDGFVTAIDARYVLQTVAGLIAKEELANSDGADVNNDGNITAVDARLILQAVAGIETEKPDTDEPADSVLAEYIEAFNSISAKAAEGTYEWKRVCSFTKDVDMGGATGVLNNVISSVDSSADLNSVVGAFLGVGESKGTQADAGKYALKAMTLTEDDVVSYEQNGYHITLYLKDSVNPTANGNTALNHVSDDFVSEADVNNALAAATSSVSVSINSSNFRYYDIKVVARVVSGVPENLTISHKLDATMGLAVSSLTVNGSGEIETKTTYSSFVF